MTDPDIFKGWEKRMGPAKPFVSAIRTWERIARCGHIPYMHTDHCGLCEVDALIQEFRDSIENISSIMVDRVIAEMNNRMARR